MVIYTPFPTDKNLGGAYNEIIASSRDEWVILKDYDVCGLTPTQLLQIPEYINKYGDGTGIFTCYTNRIGYGHQRYRGEVSEDSDIKHHIEIAKNLESLHLSVTKMPELISGFFMVVKKSAWEKVQGFPDGLLGVDDKFSRKIHKAGFDILRMDTIYLWHNYRLGKDWRDISHL